MMSGCHLGREEKPLFFGALGRGVCCQRCVCVCVCPAHSVVTLYLNNIDLQGEATLAPI